MKTYTEAQQRPFLGHLCVAAQEDAFPSVLAPKEPVARWNVGVFGGTSNNSLDIDIAYATDLDYSAAKGYTFGLSGSYYPTGWFSLHANVAMVQKNWRLDRSQREVRFVYTEATNNYLSIPVTAELSLGRTFRLCGFFGGYVGYWLTGHREGKSISLTYAINSNEDDNRFSEDYEFNSTRDNRFDAGLTYGAALRCAIAKKVDVSLELRWYYGLTDLQKNYMENRLGRYNDTRTISFGVAYWL